jgi:hypothetical protein
LLGLNAPTKTQNVNVEISDADTQQLTRAQLMTLKAKLEQEIAQIESGEPEILPAQEASDGEPEGIAEARGAETIDGNEIEVAHDPEGA